MRPIDGPFGDLQDPERYKAAADRTAILGCEGKWAIQPSQIALANAVMSLSLAEITKAKRVLKARAAAQTEGKGEGSPDGHLTDYASIRQAEILVKKAK